MINQLNLEAILVGLMQENSGLCWARFMIGSYEFQVPITTKELTHLKLGDATITIDIK